MLAHPYCDLSLNTRYMELKKWWLEGQRLLWNLNDQSICTSVVACFKIHSITSKRLKLLTYCVLIYHHIDPIVLIVLVSFRWRCASSFLDHFFDLLCRLTFVLRVGFFYPVFFVLSSSSFFGSFSRSCWDSSISSLTSSLFRFFY